MSKTLLLLGGYGNTGILIAEPLLQYSAANIIIAGRNLDKAQALTNVFNQKYPGNRVSAMRVDAGNEQDLKEAFPKVDMVVAASSTSEFVELVANCAMEAKIDYLDVQYSTPKVEALRKMEGKIEKSGCCFITEGGFHPGVPAAMVRFAAPYFDRLEKANVGSYINIDWTKLTFSDATRIELIGEMKNYRMDCFKDGEWQKGNWKNARKFDFRNGFGVKSCYPMFLEELRQLPEMIPSLKETGFFASGFSWFVTLIVLPVCLMGSKLLSEKSLRPLGKFLEWGFKVSSKPPFVTILLLEASGWKREQYQTLKVKIAHESGYVLTAVPAVACILQYLDGSIKKPGLFLQANIVEPKRFLEDMKRMGIEVEIDDSEFK